MPALSAAAVWARETALTLPQTTSMVFRPGWQEGRFPPAFAASPAKTRQTRRIPRGRFCPAAAHAAPGNGGELLLPGGVQADDPLPLALRQSGQTGAILRQHNGRLGLFPKNLSHRAAVRRVEGIAGKIRLVQGTPLT